MGWVTKATSLDKRTSHFYEGKEIALTKVAGHKPRHNGSWWPEEKRIEAATVYAVTKNLDAVQDLVGIPRGVLEKFSTEPWWDEIVGKVKKEKNEELDAKISSILEATITQIEDRIKGGEYYIDRKTKEVTRIPVRTKDLAMATDILFDKRQLLRGEATVRTEAITTEQRLENLKLNFEKLARSKLINPHSEVVDAKFTELREGLPTGSEDGISEEKAPTSAS